MIAAYSSHASLRSPKPTHPRRIAGYQHFAFLVGSAVGIDWPFLFVSVPGSGHPDRVSCNIFRFRTIYYPDVDFQASRKLKDDG